MSEDHWDSDRAYERDIEREPTYATSQRRRPQLSERGSVRVATEQAQAPVIDRTARVLLRDDGVAGPCGVEYVQPRYMGERKKLRAHCTACGFIGREHGPAEGSDAYDEAKAHVCKTDGAK